MVAHKNITKIIGVIVAAAVFLCVLTMIFPERAVETFGGAGVAVQYETELFDTDEMIRVDIRMDEGEWEDMLAHASEEEYYSCDVAVNDTKLYHVGIRPKGNTSLSSIAMDPDTDRFSLKLEFDHYVEGQTCFGLDKLILNNNYADATNMKEALVYDMYRYLEADASLYNYAEIRVNGQYWGVYLALEAVEDSFLLRNYGTADGELYKPENMDGGPGGGRSGQAPEGGGRPGQALEGGRQDQAPGDGGRPGQAPEGGGEDPGDGNLWELGRQEGNRRIETAEEGAPSGTEDGEAFRGQDVPGGGKEGQTERDELPDGEEVTGQAGRTERQRPSEGARMTDRGGPGMGGGGADLNYTDDDPDSYSTIWEGEVTDTGAKDHRRVVTALKNISEGTDPERYMDVDNLLKYMAVHVFSVNQDSLSGIMAHNYYLYESSGRLNILPWDYNLAFGGMGMGEGSNASGVVNDAIDTPFQATEFFNVLLEDEEYLARYHEYLSRLVEEYVFGGGLEAFYGRVRNQIDELVRTDPTAFYSFEEYEAGADMLYKTVLLRGKSIRGQLDGSIPSTDQGQREDSLSLVDASSIDIDAMGTFNRGRQDGDGGRGGFGDPGGGFGQDAAQEVFRGEAVPPEGMDGFRGGPNPGDGAFGGGMPGGPAGGDGGNRIQNVILYGVSLLAAALALWAAGRFERIPGRKRRK